MKPTINRAVAALRNPRRGRREGGSVLLAAIAIAFILAGLAASTLRIVYSVQNETQQERDDLVRRYLAESAAGFAELDLVAEGSGSLGSEQAPITLNGGAYWTVATRNADTTVRVDCFGAYHGGTRAISATFLDAPDLFDNAVFAGNSSGDPNYSLNFGGTGADADAVSGDIYSGGDIAFNGTSTITGTPRAKGDITGAAGKEGQTQPLPDLAAMDYANTADVDVVADFTRATRAFYSAGGFAWQLPASEKAHVFRKNPNDRAAEIASTTKDDFFLEDPYERCRSDSRSDGSDPYVITLNGDTGRAGGDGNGLVYYIDGNLWIHNKNTMSLQIEGLGSLGITIVVRGNIYISDNIFYEDKDRDGLALIAMADPSVNDSGNIYFGDPVFGTLEHMSAYMYAENNFFDTNLSASGSARVSVDGMMSAGNQVAINRDFRGRHSRLTVNYDSRVRDGRLRLPGLPSSSSGGEVTFLGWQHMAAGQ